MVGLVGSHLIGGFGGCEVAALVGDSNNLHFYNLDNHFINSTHESLYRTGRSLGFCSDCIDSPLHPRLTQRRHRTRFMYTLHFSSIPYTRQQAETILFGIRLFCKERWRWRPIRSAPIATNAPACGRQTYMNAESVIAPIVVPVPMAVGRTAPIVVRRSSQSEGFC